MRANVHALIRGLAICALALATLLPLSSGFAFAQHIAAFDTRLRGARLSTDGRRIAVVMDQTSRDRQALFIYDRVTDRLDTMPVPHEWVVRSIAPSPGFDRVAASATCRNACTDRSRESAILELSVSSKSWRTVLVGSGRRFDLSYSPSGAELLAVHTEGGPPTRDGREGNACQILVWIDISRPTETELMPRDDCFYTVSDPVLARDGRVSFAARAPWGQAKRKQVRDLDLPGGVMAMVPWRAALAEQQGGGRFLTEFSFAPVLSRTSASPDPGGMFVSAVVRDITAFVAMTLKATPGPRDLAEYDVFVSHGSEAPIRVTNLRTFINDLAVSADGSTILIRIDENRGVQGDFSLIDVETRSTRALKLVPRMVEAMKAN